MAGCVEAAVAGAEVDGACVAGALTDPVDGRLQANAVIKRTMNNWKKRGDILGMILSLSCGSSDYARIANQ